LAGFLKFFFKTQEITKQEIQSILVIGANGSTGKIICNLLQDSPSYELVVTIRAESQKEQFRQRNIQTVLGDLAKDFERAFQNINRVIFAIGAGGSTDKRSMPTKSKNLIRVYRRLFG
jgi:N-acetyl-gamma-glutamylphosphate reductase